MKFDCDRYDKKLLDWHDCFAWLPVRVESCCIWLSHLKRRGTRESSMFEGLYWNWEYKEKINE